MEIFAQLTEIITQFIDVVLHLDVYLTAWIGVLGPWIYLLVGTIIFCETGLVVTPFLPGDSFLFALGALCVTENSTLSFPVLWCVLMGAAICGDLVNYTIGKKVGPQIFKSETSRFLNKKYLYRAHAFYEKHGPKAIVLARFVPIVRTFAPFVAGIGTMKFSRFVGYSVFGGATWVTIFLTAGYYFGNLPAVKTNFHVVIFAIIIISVLPIVYEYFKARSEKGKTGADLVIGQDKV